MASPPHLPPVDTTLVRREVLNKHLYTWENSFVAEWSGNPDLVSSNPKLESLVFSPFYYFFGC